MDADRFSSFGDDGLSAKADRSLSHTEVGLRLVPHDAQDDPVPGPIWDAEVRTALDEWARIYGVPDAVPDLRLDELARRRLARSSWGTTIQILLPDGVRVLRPLRDEVEVALEGRDPEVDASHESLIVTFALEDGERDSRRRAVAFGRALALILGGIHDVRVGDFSETSPRD